MKKQNEKLPSRSRSVTPKHKETKHAELQQSPLERLLQIQSEILGIGPDKGLQDVLTSIAETANSLLGGNFSIVFPYDFPNDRFLTGQVTSGGIPEVRGFRWGEPRPTGASRTILREGELFIEDYADPKYIERYPFLRARVSDGQRIGHYQDIGVPVRATLGVRLQAGEEYFGVLVVNYPEPHHFQPAEIELGRVFASQAAIAIRNAALYLRYRALVDLSETFTALHVKSETKVTLEKVMKEIHDTLLSDLTVIFPYDASNDVFPRERIVAIGANTETYSFAEPRPNGGTRKVLKSDATVYFNINEAPDDWRGLVSTGAFVQHFGIESTVAVPLKVGEESVGVLYVNFKNPHRFGQTELNFIDAFATQVALILFNASVFEREQKARQLSDRISQASQTLLQSQQLETAYDSIITQIRALIPCDGILLMTSEGESLRARAASGFPDNDKVMTFYLNPKEDLILQRVGDISVPVIIDDVDHNKNWKPVPSAEGWVHGWMGIRLSSKGQVIGEIGLYSTKTGFFKDEHKAALLEFSSLAALAIENARYFGHLQRISDLQRQILAMELDLDQVIDRILEAMLETMQTDVGQVLLLDEDGEGLIISATTSSGDRDRKLSVNDSVTGSAVRERKVIRVGNVRTDPKYGKYYKAPRGKERELQSELVAPLFVGNNIIGVLNVEHEDENRFSDYDADLLAAIANVTASAIERAKSVVHEISLLGEVEKLMVGKTFRMEDVFNVVLRHAMDITKAKSGEVLLLEGSSYLRDKIALAEGRPIELERVSLHESVSGIAVKEKKSVLVNDLQSDERFSEMYPPFKKLYRPVLGHEMRSELVVPLLANERAMGVINLESEAPNAFTRHHQTLLETLSNDAVYAIQTTQERQAQETIAIIQQELVGTAFDLTKVLEKILQGALNLTEASLGQILLVETDESNQKILRIRTSTLAGQPDVGSRVEIDDSVTGIAVNEKKAFRIANVKTEEPYRHVYKEMLGFNIFSEMVVPLISDEEVVGVINIESSEIGAFTEEHEKFVSLLAQQAVVTLRLANAFAEVETLRSIQDRILTENITLIDVSQEILRNARKLIGAETGQVLLLNDAKDQLSITASTNSDDVGTTVLVADSVSGLAVLRRETIIVNDITTEEPYKFLYKRFLGPDMHSEIVVPLRVGNEIVGVLNAESPRLGAFSRHQADVLSTLAGQAAMSIRTAEQLELRRKATEMDKNLSAGQIIHRLTGRAAAIRNWSETLREIAQEESSTLASNETFSFAIDDIEAKAQNILSLVDEYKRSITELYSEREIAPLIEEAIKKAEIPAQINVSTTWDSDLPKVRATSALVDVFWNILMNAVHVMPEGGSIDITARTVSNGNKLCVSIKDTGPGIPAELHEAIFEPNFSGRKGGHGLGLYWSRAFVKAINGEITVDSSPDRGTCFNVILPAL